MPIFDFACTKCGNKFDIMIANAAKDSVRCPQCGAADVIQLFSSFNTGGGGKIKKDSCQSCQLASSGG